MTLRPALAALLGLAFLPPVRGAELADPLGDAARSAPVPLNGLTVGSGPAAWQATANLTAGAAAAAATDARAFVGRVPLPPDAQTIRVSAEVRPVPAAGRNWVAVGLGNPADGAVSWGKGVCLLVDSDGFYRCNGDNDPADYESKAAVLLAAGHVPGDDPDHPAMARVVLEFDRDRGTVRAEINGVEVVHSLVLADKGIRADLACAGFSGYGQKTGAPVARAFSVVTAP